MGYDIGEVSGNSTAGASNYTFELDLSDPNATTVSGDFDEINLFGLSLGDAAGGYTFSALSNPAFGTLTTQADSGVFTFTVDRGAVLNTNSNQVVTFTVTGSDGTNSDTDTVTINILICVARGTLVMTDAGPRRVEEIGVSDRIITLDGPPRPVRWIGSRVLSAEELRLDPSLRPIRITKGALGAATPERDLIVSPQHRVLLRGWRAELFFGEEQVLVPAKGLANDRTITVAHDLETVEYFHLLFDRHEIILTENLPTESFFPGAHSMAGLDAEVRSELLRLFPGLAGTGYGPSARPSLKPWEARVLADDRAVAP